MKDFTFRVQDHVLHELILLHENAVLFSFGSQALKRRVQPTNETVPFSGVFLFLFS
jgi:hypothetical protein